MKRTIFQKMFLFALVFLVLFQFDSHFCYAEEGIQPYSATFWIGNTECYVDMSISGNTVNITGSTTSLAEYDCVLIVQLVGESEPEETIYISAGQTYHMDYSRDFSKQIESATASFSIATGEGEGSHSLHSSIH